MISEAIEANLNTKINVRKMKLNLIRLKETYCLYTRVAP
jgi:hypothetical protein